MAIVSWANTAEFQRRTSILFPKGVDVTPCKKITHRYLEKTPQGVIVRDISYNIISRITIAHEMCVASKTNDFLDFAMENAARAIR